MALQSTGFHYGIDPADQSTFDTAKMAFLGNLPVNVCTKSFSGNNDYVIGIELASS